MAHSYKFGAKGNGIGVTAVDAQSVDAKPTSFNDGVPTYHDVVQAPEHESVTPAPGFGFKP